MTDACTIRAAQAQELAGPLPMQPASVLDLSGCDRLELLINLFEHETAGLRFESWPATVRERIETMIAGWQGRNPGRALRAVTCAVLDRNCVMIIHHSPKG